MTTGTVDLKFHKVGTAIPYLAHDGSTFILDPGV